MGLEGLLESRGDYRSGAMVDIYGNPGKQNAQQRSQKWLPFLTEVSEEGAAVVAARMGIGRSMGPSRHQARPTRSTGGSKLAGPWALAHVTPRPATVSEKPKTASHSCHAYLKCLY